MENFNELHSQIQKALTVKFIMTPYGRLIFGKLSEKVGRYKDTIRKMDFDFLPLSDEDGNIVAFTTKDEVENADPAAVLKTIAKGIPEENKVPDDLPVIELLKNDELLDKLRSSLLFVTSGDRVVGIITYADLNKKEIRILFYHLIVEFESTLAHIIQSKYPDPEEFIKTFSESFPTEPLGEWYKAKLNNLNLHPVEYLSFSQIINLIRKDKELLKEVGLTKKTIKDKVSKIIELRNKVMHSNRSLIVEGGDLREILEGYDFIMLLLEKLSKYTAG